MQHTLFVIHPLYLASSVYPHVPTALKREKRLDRCNMLAQKLLQLCGASTQAPVEAAVPYVSSPHAELSSLLFHYPGRTADTSAQQPKPPLRPNPAAVTAWRLQTHRINDVVVDGWGLVERALMRLRESAAVKWESMRPENFDGVADVTDFLRANAGCLTRGQRAGLRSWLQETGVLVCCGTGDTGVGTPAATPGTMDDLATGGHRMDPAARTRMWCRVVARLRVVDTVEATRFSPDWNSLLVLPLSTLALVYESLADDIAALVGEREVCRAYIRVVFSCLQTDEPEAWLRLFPAVCDRIAPFLECDAPPPTVTFDMDDLVPPDSDAPLFEHQAERQVVLDAILQAWLAASSQLKHVGQQELELVVKSIGAVVPLLGVCHASVTVPYLSTLAALHEMLMWVVVAVERISSPDPSQDSLQSAWAAVSGQLRGGHDGSDDVVAGLLHVAFSATDLSRKWSTDPRFKSTLMSKRLAEAVAAISRLRSIIKPSDQQAGLARDQLRAMVSWGKHSTTVPCVLCARTAIRATFAEQSGWMSVERLLATALLSPSTCPQALTQPGMRLGHYTTHLRHLSVNWPVARSQVPDAPMKLGEGVLDVWRHASHAAALRYAFMNLAASDVAKPSWLPHRLLEFLGASEENTQDLRRRVAAWLDHATTLMHPNTTATAVESAPELMHLDGTVAMMNVLWVDSMGRDESGYQRLTAAIDAEFVPRMVLDLLAATVTGVVVADTAFKKQQATGFSHFNENSPLHGALLLTTRGLRVCYRLLRDHRPRVGSGESGDAWCINSVQEVRHRPILRYPCYTIAPRPPSYCACPHLLAS